MRLKLGPAEFTFREKPRTKLEIGSTGTVFFGGRLSEEEYNSDLRGDKAIQVYERMRKSDGQVKGAILACTLPLLEAKWDVTPGGDSAQDKEMADFVRDNLFDWMTITWDNFLRQALLMLSFGFSPFEKVWELHNGKYRWRKLAPRLPKTRHEWSVDSSGGLESFTQYAQKDGMHQFMTIPVEKLLLFTHELEGSNFEGVSLLRAAYKHWYYKDQLYRIDGIAAERHGVGVAAFSLPSTATTEGTDSDYSKIGRMGEALHTHERSYVALPDSYGFELKGVSGQLHDIMKSAEHHDLQIVRSILAQFINLGSTKVGSYAMSQDQSGFFLMALRTVGKNVCSTMNRYGIKQLVDYNWETDRYPKLTVSGLEHRDIVRYSKAITDVTKAGLIFPDEGIEDELRRFLHLPAKKPKKSEPTTEEIEKALPKLRLAETSKVRQLKTAETNVAFADIGARLDSAENLLVAAAKDVQARQIVKIVDMAVKDMQENRTDKIAAIDVPYREQMADAIESVLLGLFDYGRDQVRSELAGQRQALKLQEPLASASSDVTREFIKTRSKSIANVLGSKLRAAMTWEALRQIRTGAVNRLSFASTLTSLSDKELVSTAKFSVSEALSLGRHDQAKTEAGNIDRVIYSAILDTNTCTQCADRDGEEFSFPSAEWDEVMPPYKNCEGRDRCRCVGVYVYKEELPISPGGVPIAPPEPVEPPLPAMPSDVPIEVIGDVSEEVKANLDSAMRSVPPESRKPVSKIKVHSADGHISTYDHGEFKVGATFNWRTGEINIFDSERYTGLFGARELRSILGHETGHSAMKLVGRDLIAEFGRVTQLEGAVTDYAREHLKAVIANGVTENFAEVHGAFVMGGMAPLALKRDYPLTYELFKKIWTTKLGGIEP